MTNNSLCILCPDRIYPQQNGGALRTLNIAKLAVNMFSHVSVLSVDEEITYDGNLDGIRLLQAQKYHTSFDKLKYFFDGAFSSDFSLKAPDLRSYTTNSTLVQIEGPYFYNALKKSGIKNFILNEHNVYWEFGRYPAYNTKELIYYRFTYNRNKSIEIKALKDATHVLACSERDAHILINEVPEVEGKITVVPNCVNFKEYQSFHKDHPHTDDERRSFTILFIGLLTYSPNHDAVEIICSQIAPNFGEDVQFVIIGKNPPNIPKPANVQFLGYVKDVKEYIQRSDICIAPLRYGSGTRFKILEYMAMGKPVISTSKGAEGLDYTHGENIIIEDDINAFSKDITSVLDDKQLRNKLGKNAMELIKQKYDWEIYRKPLLEVYEACR